MAFEHPGEGSLDYLPCRYGTSKLLFRGPKKKLDGPYVAFFGGTETYGRFIEAPYPTVLEQRLGATMVNLGCLNAGVDVYAQDAELLSIASGARATVVQVMGAQNLTNRFYSVHPRRNDRFVGASALMQTVFREIDFTDFSFNRHLLRTLGRKCPQRFELIVDELKSAWLARMRLLLGKLKGKTVLLWLSDHAPDEELPGVPGALHDPLFVDRTMVDTLRPMATEYVEVVVSPAAQAAGTAGMVFSELEAPVAAETLGVMAHSEAVEALEPVLKKHL